MRFVLIQGPDYNRSSGLLLLEDILGLNPLVTNGFSHPSHLDESTFSFMGIRSKISFLFHFSMNFL